MSRAVKEAKISSQTTLNNNDIKPATVGRMYFCVVPQFVYALVRTLSYLSVDYLFAGC